MVTSSTSPPPVRSAQHLSLPLPSLFNPPLYFGMETSAIRSAVLQPFSTDQLPEPESDSPLFLPADARRRWYLGYLEHWKDLQHRTTRFWESEGVKKAFDELKDHKLDEPRGIRAASEDDEGPTQFENMSRREVLQVVEAVFSKLLATETGKKVEGDNPIEHIFTSRGRCQPHS
ncbi:hypothetical protein BKA58DRAFT_59835 [Alternaria rosae]|uniref:uncharacterized protein n=2 Tax=Alternaria rosae TaxID=1187941 RepID=UPI001E8E1CE3|nr:uncharacterized protein BKA58DRAFT_59835 [Alternaria rosae]KAH6852811.1 hypothetical protein BKA58DRAFT_59835 [Alternaria rosae]